MTRIDPSANLIARIRAQLASARSSGKRRSSPGVAVASAQDLMSTVANRIAAVSPQDTNRERKALRIFLEAVVLDEFGADLAGDPRLQDMLDHVQAQFDADPELKRAASEAARQLLGEAGT